MFEISKKFLFHSLRIIGLITLIHMIVLYWFPGHFPLSSFLPIVLMFLSYGAKAYYLIPIAVLICVLMVVAARSFKKERILWPVIFGVYLLCDSVILGHSFFDAWVCDGFFIATQAIQLVVNMTVAAFMCIYFSCYRKCSQQSCVSG